MVRKYIRKRSPAKYSGQDLTDAMDDVKNGKMKIKAAAKHFRIPYATLFKRVKGLRGIKSITGGRPTALPLKVETQIADCIKKMDKCGFGLSKEETILAIAEYVKVNKLQTPFVSGVPGDDFFRNFKRRHHLSQKKPQAVEVARKRGADPFVMTEYFKLLKQVTTNVPPEQIYNIDETSFCLDPSRVKTVGETGRAAHRVTGGSGKENFTVLMGGNAAGDKLPPLIIFKGSNVWNSWMASKCDEFPGIVYAATKNGWMETDVFANYFERSFLSATAEGQLVLLYDGHVSHVSLALIQKAIENNVVILKLPPHTSHLLQPMDLAVFKPLKQDYDKCVIQWQRNHYGTKLSKSAFSNIISKVWRSFDSQIIKNGFRKAGVYPFSDKVIPEDKYEPRAWARFIASQQAAQTLDDNTVEIVEGSKKALPRVTNTRDAASATCNCIASSTGNDQMENDNPQNNSFEAILLDHVKQIPVSKAQRKKVCPGAEVITSTDAVVKLETIKSVKEATQKAKRKRASKKS
ncbi:uncharacterized protein LOC129776875 [Toxorhynchites rutilus septentrionalis]|uniref:uncharacterized protein LOC129776875 n=1 Tax=Toxorhynchites rutilus septentrionalis TaxID=329112 RepID=UPI0024790A98|nr:uncharacterized protein LOC129776875 [Toxorhynchites rutilus septentrionalis]